MENFTPLIQVIIVLLGSAITVYIGLKVGLAESRKDILYMTKQIDTLDTRITSHIDGPTHPTRDQISHLAGEITEMKKHIEATHNRIERKVDTLMESIVLNKHS